MTEPAFELEAMLEDERLDEIYESLVKDEREPQVAPDLRLEVASLREQVQHQYRLLDAASNALRRLMAENEALRRELSGE